MTNNLFKNQNGYAIANNLFAAFVILLVTTACGGGNTDQEGEETSTNAAPVVSVSDGFSVNESEQVSLNAQASDSDGSIQNTEWTQLSGVPVSLENANTVNASFIAPQVTQSEVLTFEIRVTDDDGATAIASVNVTVNDIPNEPERFSLSGQLTGSSGIVELNLNGIEQLVISSNGGFEFQTQLTEATDYLVTLDQTPEGQTCNIENASGVIDADVSNINVDCQTLASNICSDGIDNDNDGLTDWQEDLGCTSQTDGSEGGLATHEIENGWSVIEPVVDSVIYFVSSSEGSDDNDGLSSGKAFLTYAKAYQTARADHPDWILLKRGDIFEEDIQIHSGRSAGEPFVISSYGDSSIRPLILTGSNDGLNFNGDFAFISVIGLDFYAHTRNPDDPDYVDGTGGSGFRLWRESGSRGNDILIENCVFRYFVLSSVQGQTAPENISIRRNIMEYNYATNSHSQGVFSRGAINFVFEENIMDHNGWLIQSFDEGQTGGQATKFNHNTYFNSIVGLRYKNNAIMRGSSMGSKFTAQDEASDLLIENNLYLDNEIAIGMGQNYDHNYRFKRISILDNLVTNMGQSRPTNRVLGWGMQIDGLDDSSISDNYFINSPSIQVVNTFALEIFPELREINFDNNIIHGISAGNSRGLLRLYGDASQENVRFQNNQITSPLFARNLIETDESSLQNFQFTANTYFSSRDNNSWFELGNLDVSYESWIAETSEINASNQMPNYCDTQRNIETYQTSIGETPTQKSFIENIKKQGKFHWDPRYEIPTVNQWIKDGYSVCQ